MIFGLENKRLIILNIYSEGNNEKEISIESPGKKILILNPKDQIIAEKIENFVKKYKVKYLSESKVINQ